MAARLRTAGFPDEDIHVFETAPKRGDLVARLRGTGKRKPILLMAHIDVVEAKREDWTMDPFQLMEKDGYFYGRGTGDDKYMAATFVSNLIRYKKEHYKPDRDLILVLETDEESGDAIHHGIGWLLQNHRDLIDAQLALNEGGGVGVKDGKPIYNSIQTSEKVYQSETTRQYFDRLSKIEQGGTPGQNFATDSLYLRTAGIASYGHSGLANDIFDVRAHGKDERVNVKAFFTGQEYLYELVKKLSGGR
jgi:acetylornithine deacetylase/succinyl-diaminopimelate desuccinylase-like protein